MATNSALYLGIDAGSTKTHALIADRKGHMVGLGQAGPGNWEGVGLEGAYLTYSAALEEALAHAGLPPSALCAAGYGLAGLDWASDGPRLEAVVARLGVPGPRVLVNDAYAALRAGTQAGHGVAIIAGTGTTVAGCNRHGQRFRTFGEGWSMGDLGGASDIVWLAVQAVACAHTGRGQPTALSERLPQVYGLVSALELLEKIARHEVERPRAALAPLVFEVAAAGDAVAQAIIRYAGRELGENAAAVARRLGLADGPFELVLAGGVFRSKSEMLIQALLEPVRALAPAVQSVLLDTAPVVGSVLLAMEAAGERPSPEAHGRLAAETRVWVERLSD